MRIIDSQYRSQDLMELMNQLPTTEGEAVSLRYEQGLTIQESAEVLSLPIQTVASRAQRGLERLKTSMTARGLAAVSVLEVGELLTGAGIPPLPSAPLETISQLISGEEIEFGDLTNKTADTYNNSAGYNFWSKGNAKFNYNRPNGFFQRIRQ